jgi:hypothetical protein
MHRTAVYQRDVAVANTLIPGCLIVPSSGQVDTVHAAVGGFAVFPHSSACE